MSRRPRPPARSTRAGGQPPAVVATASLSPSGYGGTALYPVSQDSTQRGWRPALDRDVAALVPQYRHRAMLSDARFIYTRVGQVSGAVREKKNYTVGKAWVPQYLGTDAKFKAAFNQVISQGWLKNADLRGRPYDFQHDVDIACVSLDREGDCFIYLTESEQGSPRLQFLESHRIGSPWGQSEVTEGIYKGKQILAGIVYDEFQRPVAYNLLPADTGNRAVLSPTYNFIPAASIQHVFDPEYFSQGRGIPTICNGILDWYDMDEMRNAEKIGVKSSSRIALLETNDTGRADPTKAYQEQVAAAKAAGTTAAPSQVNVNERLIQDGLIRYFRAGSGNKLEAFSSNRPGASWESFIDHIGRSAHRGLDWPIEMHDLRGIGGASVRALVGQVKRSVENRQEVLWAPFKVAVLYAVARYMERGDLPFAADWDNVGFSLPPTFGVDVGRDQENRRLNIAMGIENLGDYVTEGGKGDLEGFLRTNARTWKLVERIAAEEGVDPERVFNPGVASQPAATAYADDPAPAPEEEPAPARGGR
jgi:hypothetical protein